MQVPQEVSLSDPKSAWVARPGRGTILCPQRELSDGPQVGVILSTLQGLDNNNRANSASSQLFLSCAAAVYRDSQMSLRSNHGE
jgi:hypothetical protein